ncbi:MAG: hypothetical protein F6K16_16385 [Symploca sp. SIO2B6]|nr:hypothetical protein [Symploca sp. SIO2B6]
MNEQADVNSRIKGYATSLNQLLRQKLQFFQDNSPKEIQIGLWGTAGSGKTAYFASLYQELVRSPEWLLECNEEASEYIEDILEYFESGTFPPPTPPRNLQIYQYRLTGQSGAVQGFSVTLLFIDAAGEFYENHLEGAGKVEGETDVLEYLKSCHGIIFLLDPKRDKNLNRMRKKLPKLLSGLMMEFQKRSQSAFEDQIARRLQQYMAFCVTKIDDEGLWEEAQHPETLARKLLGRNMYEALKHNYCLEGRFKFYGVSSVGRYKEGDEWKPAVKYPGDDSKQTNSQSQGNSQINQPQTKSIIDDLLSPISEPVEPINISSSNFSQLSSEPDYGMPSNVASQPNQTLESKLPTFDPEKEPVPLNVIAPIRWLIESIRAKPPSLPKPKETQNQ